MNAKHVAVKRQGFTLVELLVVIAIISILIGLITAAVMRTVGTVPVTQTAQEINQLAMAVENFRTRYKIYPPSKILLANDIKVYNGSSDPNVTRSLQIIQTIWPRIVFNNSTSIAGFPATPTPPLDWSSGLNKPMLDSTGIWLDGDQSLVFFLGGVRNTTGISACLGFSKNPLNPTILPSVQGESRDIFFEFNSARLFARPFAPTSANMISTPSLTNTFFSYADFHKSPVWTAQNAPGAPYLYFSSGGKKKDGYNDAYPIASFTTKAKWNGAPIGYASPQGAPHAIALPNSGGNPQQPNLVGPYYFAVSNNVVSYMNGSTFQIISAGADGIFGPGSGDDNSFGGLYNLNNASACAAVAPSNLPATNGNSSNNGLDDQGNFPTGGKIGFGEQ